jgi:hypothetical protein
MDIKDVKYNLLLRTDINQLRRSCLVDKVSTNICNSKIFWEDKYNYDGIPMLKFRDDLFLNINEYQCEKACWEKRGYPLQRIDEEDSLHLFILLNSVNDFDVLPKELENILLRKYLLSYATKVRDGIKGMNGQYDPELMISPSDQKDKYILILPFIGDNRFLLSEYDTKMILYKSLYNGMSYRYLTI